MDHSYIEEHNIIDRYEMGKLPPASCADFEEHLIDCRECQEQLAETEEFRQGFKTVAAEDAARQPAFAPIPPWHMRLAPSWRGAVLIAVTSVILVSASILVLFFQRRAFNGQLSESRLAAKDFQQRYENGIKERTELQKRLNEAGNKEIVSLASARPFRLSTVRGDDRSGPVNWVVISNVPQWVLFLPDIDEERVLGYHATLLDPDNHALWEENQYTPSNTVAIAIRPGLLHQGTYVLTVEVRHQQGQASYRYPFSVKNSK
jgi:hypothetical protein